MATETEKRNGTMERNEDFTGSLNTFYRCTGPFRISLQAHYRPFTGQTVTISCTIARDDEDVWPVASI